MRAIFGSPIAVCVLAIPFAMPARAADVPITALKLVIVDKTTASGTAKAVFATKDPAVTKGAGTDPAAISALLQVSYDGASGQFAMPQGDRWLVNSTRVAKYVNREAPSGGSVKVGVVKPALVSKVVAKSTGDDPLDISQPPSGAVSVAETITNGAETIRHCTMFSGCVHKTIAGGTGWKLVCKTGMPDAACSGFGAPVCGDGVLTEGESCDPPGSTCGAGLTCDSSCRCHVCGNGVTEDGEQCDDGDTTPGDGCDGSCQLEEFVSGANTVTTDGEADGATASDPVEATVTSPVPGTITILETSAAGDPPAGFQLLGRLLEITAPAASPAMPLVLDFLLDASLVGDLSPGAIIVFRNGVAVPGCAGGPGVAQPDPCIASRVALPDDDVEIVALSSQASPWGFGANVVFTLTTTAPVGTCGALKRGGSGGTVAKSLTCGGLNIGGGLSTFMEMRFPSGGQTQLNGTCDDTACTISGRSAAETGNGQVCSQPGCPFSPLVPVPNAGISLCVAHTFAAPPTGTLDHTLGSFTGSLSLSSAVYLTSNAASPCPRCLGGAVGIPSSGACDPAWTTGNGLSSPDAGAPCTPTDVAGATYDCEPPASVSLPALPFTATSLTTGTAVLSAPGGEFCALQANPGAFGCAGSGAPTATCPGGNVPPVPDYIETSGTPAGAITPGPHPIRLASAFCVPPVGGSLGVLINQAADLPGPGALTLPGTIDVATATVVTTTSTTSTTITPPSGPRLRLTMAPPGGTCGALRAGGAGGTVVKNLSCGGLDIGGGGSTFVEALMPSGGVTEFDADCTGSVCALGALAAADTSSNQTCSTTGCRFGPYVPFSNAGFSLCMAHTLSAPATGTLDTAAGTFVGSIILDSAAYLTSNASMPCPRCVGGAPGVSGSGVCDPAWLSSHGASPNASQPCTPVNLTGDTADCEPAPGGLLSAIVLNLSPLTTAGASDTGPGGGFCPSQSTPGAFGCNGDGSPTSNCPGDAPAVPDYIEVTGLAAGALTPGAHPIRLASTFCIPSAGGSLGAIINSAADLPGPGAITLPATVEFLP